MVVKRPSRKIEFIERDEDFIRQLAKDIGCHYCKANERTYNLNQNNSNIHGEMDIFAWVHKEDKDYFWVTTRRIWVEEAKARAMSRGKKEGIHCFPHDENQGDSICLNTRDDYPKTVRALKLMKKAR